MPPLLPTPSYRRDILVSQMVMEKKRLPSLPQLAKIASLLLLFLLAPLVPSSLRPPYLYLLFNALVVALGVEAGFLSGPRDEKKPPSPTTGAASPNLTKPPDNVVVTDSHLAGGTTVTPTRPNSLNLKEARPADAVVKDVAGAANNNKKKKIKKCPSRASIFFIGGVDADVEAVDATVQEEEWEDAGELMSKQELFTKAEAFIGNFYKQLKMQREESWKKLQDLYYHHHLKAKAF